jgi:hypothetical protein
MLAVPIDGLEVSWANVPETALRDSKLPVLYDLWKDVYYKENLSNFPCPRCKTGQLVLKEDTLSILEPTYSKNEQLVDGSEFHWIVERFIGFLQCNNNVCGEFSASNGNVTINYDEYDGGYTRELHVNNINPAPPIISLPDKLPRLVRQEIEKSFSLFWNDKGACANSLRKSVERLLDDFKIPSTKMNKKGEDCLIPLNKRIEEFKKVDPEHSDALDALKFIGNIGSHEVTVSLKKTLAGC